MTLSKPFHQHSSAVATMINPCDLLLFDRAAQPALAWRAQGRRRFVSGRELYEDQESCIGGRLLRVANGGLRATARRSVIAASCPLQVTPTRVGLPKRQLSFNLGGRGFSSCPEADPIELNL